MYKEEAAAIELSEMLNDHRGGENCPPDIDDKREIEEVADDGPEIPEEKKLVKLEKSSKDDKKLESENQACPACNKTLKNVVQHIDKSQKCKAKVSTEQLENLKKKQIEKRKLQNKENVANFRKRQKEEERKCQTKNDVKNFRKRKLEAENGEDTKRSS